VPRRPLDILNCGVTLSLLALAGVLAAAGRLADWRTVVQFHAGLVLLVLAVVWVEKRFSRSRAGQLLANAYPLPLIGLVFNSLQPLITGLGMPNQDSALIAIDRALLGGDAAVYLAPFIRPWLNDVLHVAYCTYYVFPIVVAWAIWRRSHERCRRFIFAVVLAFYVSYVGYFIVPARGPRLAQWPAAAVETRSTPISRSIYDFLNAAEKTKDDVFPSGHAMIAAVCLMAVYRSDRRIFWLLLPVGLALALATVYCRFHYVIDVAVGLALAGVTLPLANAIYDRRAVVADVCDG
jgi:membrane-associated phospholipid phosphatase